MDPNIYVHDKRQAQRQEPTTCEEAISVTTDYLRAVCRHTRSSVGKRLGDICFAGLDAEFISATQPLGMTPRQEFWKMHKRLIT